MSGKTDFHCAVADVGSDCPGTLKARQKTKIDKRETMCFIPLVQSTLALGLAGNSTLESGSRPVDTQFSPRPQHFT
jgi:hypothetical protein